jgi:dihydrofolate reductase
MSTSLDIYVIVAMTGERIIGNDNKIPWHIPDDLKMFKQLTTGNVVIMGRRTFESIGKPLPNRHNIIISNTMPPVAGAEIYSCFDDGIRRAKELDRKIFCIGGEKIYKKAIEVANFMYISWINDNYDGDTKFPDFDLCDWELVDNVTFKEFSLCYYKKSGIIMSPEFSKAKFAYCLQ